MSPQANIAEEEGEEEDEEAEEDTLLADKKKRTRRPQSKKKSKAQPAASAAHEADGVDEDGFAYNAAFLVEGTSLTVSQWDKKQQAAN